MGLARRMVRKSVRKATPRPVRKVMHPARTVGRAVTPRPGRQVSRAVYTVTNPLGAAENKLIGAALNGGSRTAPAAAHPPAGRPGRPGRERLAAGARPGPVYGQQRLLPLTTGSSG